MQVSGWDLVNDGGTLKLHRSWKVKTFTKGLEFFQEVANVAEAEGICTRVYSSLGVIYRSYYFMFVVTHKFSFC